MDTPDTKATIASLIVGPYREINPHMDTAGLQFLLDDLERQFGNALEEATSGHQNMLGTMGELAKRAAAAEALAQHYGERYRETVGTQAVLAGSERRAVSEADAARSALEELKRRHATLTAEHMRLIGYLDAIDPIVDIPQAPVQQTRRRYVLGTGPRPTPADVVSQLSREMSNLVARRKSWLPRS